MKRERCGTALVVERYGGGQRWHCPTCDKRWNDRHMTVVTWTNSAPPAGRHCANSRRSYR